MSLGAWDSRHGQDTRVSWPYEGVYGERIILLVKLVYEVDEDRIDPRTAVREKGSSRGTMLYLMLL